MEIWLYKVTRREPGGGLGSVEFYFVMAASEEEARAALEAEHQGERTWVELSRKLGVQDAQEVRQRGGWILRVRDAQAS